MKPILYIVATPIGNLQDITLRAIEILKTVDIIAAEDTRHTIKLLNHFQIIPKKLISYQGYSEKSKSQKFIEMLIKDNLSLALVSDAGTPCISDPGHLLVSEAYEAGVTVCPIPGASSLTALASVCGQEINALLFIGFLPNKKQHKQTLIESWSLKKEAIVFFESPKRILETLEIIQKIYPLATVTVGRELTKLHESIFKGSIDKACKEFADTRGEFVVLLHLNQTEELIREEKQTEEQKSLLKELLNAGFSVKTIADNLAEWNKKELYNFLVGLKKK